MRNSREPASLRDVVVQDQFEVCGPAGAVTDNVISPVLERENTRRDLDERVEPYRQNHSVCADFLKTL